MTFQPQPGRIVLTMSADPVLDPDLCDGAVRLLMLLRSLAGHSRVLLTLSQSLATALRRHADTIREWRDQLAARGYLSHSTDPRTGWTTILLCETIEPPSRRARMAAQREEDAKPTPLPWQKPKQVILKPDPKPWGAPPWINPWRETRADSNACEGGAGRDRDIKTRKIPLPILSDSVPACESEAVWRKTPSAIGAEAGWEAQPPVRTPAEQIAAVGCEAEAAGRKTPPAIGAEAGWQAQPPVRTPAEQIAAVGCEAEAAGRKTSPAIEAEAGWQAQPPVGTPAEQIAAVTRGTAQVADWKPLLPACAQTIAAETPRGRARPAPRLGAPPSRPVVLEPPTPTKPARVVPVAPSPSPEPPPLPLAPTPILRASTLTLGGKATRTAGTVRLLILRRSLAGPSRVLLTLTQTLATALRRRADTLRGWRDQLAVRGYLSHSTDPRTDWTTRMAAQCEEDAKPTPVPWQKPRRVMLKPDSKPWRAPAWINPGWEFRVASRACEGGAGRGRDIKTRKIPFPILSESVPAREAEAAGRKTPPAIGTKAGWEAQPPVRTPAEQIAVVRREAEAVGRKTPQLLACPQTIAGETPRGRALPSPRLATPPRRHVVPEPPPPAKPARVVPVASPPSPEPPPPPLTSAPILRASTLALGGKATRTAERPGTPHHPSAPRAATAAAVLPARSQAHGTQFFPSNVMRGTTE